MKTTLLLIAAIAVFPIASDAGTILKIELSLDNAASKPRTISIPLSDDGRPVTSRSGTEITLWHRVPSSSAVANTEVANSEFFGVTVTAQRQAGITYVHFDERTLLGTTTSLDGTSQATETTENTLSLELSAPRTELSSKAGYKRIVCILLPTAEPSQ
jgi:hypothetical protein